jgi:hypothetical protein
LDRCASRSLLQTFIGINNDKLTTDLMKEMEGLAVELAGPNPTPVESLLARTAATCWVWMRGYEIQTASAASTLHVNPGKYDPLQRRIDHAHQRMLKTLKTLAEVRRLALPALQINIARRQVNQMNAGQPESAHGP